MTEDGLPPPPSAATQNWMVLDHLVRYGPITPLDALNAYGVFRLAARIYDLRKRGHSIITYRFHTNTGKVVGQYVLLKRAPGTHKETEA